MAACAAEAESECTQAVEAVIYSTTAAAPNPSNCTLPPVAVMSVVRTCSVANRREIVRPARLRSRARQTIAAERLHADHRADLVAVDVEIADARMLGDDGRPPPRCGCARRASGRSRWR